MADEENNAPVGANEAPRFEPGEHLKELASHQRFGGYQLGDSLSPEEMSARRAAEVEADLGQPLASQLGLGPYYDRDLTGIRVRALELALQGAHGDAHHEGVIARAEAFHRFLTGKAAD